MRREGGDSQVCVCVYLSCLPSNILILRANLFNNIQKPIGLLFANIYSIAFKNKMPLFSEVQLFVLRCQKAAAFCIAQRHIYDMLIIRSLPRRFHTYSLFAEWATTFKSQAPLTFKPLLQPNKKQCKALGCQPRPPLTPPANHTAHYNRQMFVHSQSDD